MVHVTFNMTSPAKRKMQGVAQARRAARQDGVPFTQPGGRQGDDDEDDSDENDDDSDDNEMGTDTPIGSPVLQSARARAVQQADKAATKARKNTAKKAEVKDFADARRTARLGKRSITSTAMHGV